MRLHLVEGPLAVAGLGPVPIHHHPKPRPESCHQSFADVVVDAANAPQVQFGLDAGVGPVGVLSARATGRAEPPRHLGRRDPASGTG